MLTWQVTPGTAAFMSFPRQAWLPYGLVGSGYTLICCVRLSKGILPADRSSMKGPHAGANESPGKLGGGGTSCGGA